MLRKIFFPVLMGVAGCGVLLWLGFWQLDRLAWKEGILDEINARLAVDPVLLPDAPREDEDEYRTIVMTGAPTGQELHVLVSGTAAGTGYRVIAAFETADGRRVMLDQGLLPLEAKDAPPVLQQAEVVGNLIWPDDRNSSTPDPDLPKNIWFARDVEAMAEALGTEPLMVVLRDATALDPRLTPLPVDTGGIKNDHREYAITWFLLALVWAVMTVFLITRTLRRKD